jgi:hypothetical protein
MSIGRRVVPVIVAGMRAGVRRGGGTHLVAPAGRGLPGTLDGMSERGERFGRPGAGEWPGVTERSGVLA